MQRKAQPRDTMARSSHRRPRDAQDRNRDRIMAPMLSMRILLIASGCFVAVILFFLLVGKFGLAERSIVSGTVANAPNALLFTDPDEIPMDLLLQMDAVMILGGGKPTSLDQPPVYVQRRCDDAAAVVFRHKQLSLAAEASMRRKELLPVLCLSAGTAHLPQLMSEAQGLPIWESTSTAAYLSLHFNMSHNVFVETTSFDTIGNAFYARTSHTDIVGWRRLLIVTNEFHMARTRAIFDWIFGLDDGNDYKLYYLESPNVGLSENALLARSEKEAKSVKSVEAFAMQYRKLDQVWWFLNSKHDLYSASKLVERGRVVNHHRPSDSETELIKMSYGGTR